jgi:cytochrome c oxidase cbb3-type subunit 3
MKLRFINNKIFLTALIVASSQGLLLAAGDSDHYIFSQAIYWLFLAAVIAIIGYAAITIYKLTLLFIKVKEDQIREKMGLPPEAPEPASSAWMANLYNKLTDVVPVEREADVMLDHDYDGIRELDNNLPPWWIWMFYITIFIGVVYFGYYHMSPYGMSSTEQYEYAMAQAADEIKAYQATQGNLIDENTLEALTDEASLELGRGIFVNLCAACHLVNGGGSVGPNLTDQYWIHGGSISDLYKTVKYGVPEKGMISWQAQLSPKDMHLVSSYILTLQGTNPPDGKAPQGELYEAPAEE